MTWEAEDVLSIDLVDPEGADLPAWQPGAHIDLVFNPFLIRQYSLCSDPTNRKAWSIAVLREPDSGGGSRYVHETLRPGMMIETSEPRNRFPFEPANSTLFIAGGIGITPILPMIEQIAHSGLEWRLLYGGRRRSSMAFLSRLASYGGRVTVVPQDEFGLLNLTEAIHPLPAKSAIYCCGPEALIEAAESECLVHGQATLNVERFSARPGQDSLLLAQEASNTEFEVVLGRTSQRIKVREDQSIANALEENGVYVPTSCTEGYCGTCETVVLAGVPDHRDDYLTDDEKTSNNMIMLCCSRSKTRELVIDL